ncbi:MAG: beta-galactosidase GalA [Opitutaceae bacterium]|jgi:beta-galactosidase
MKTAVSKFLLFLCALFAACSLRTAAFADPIQRERLLMDFGWRFHLGNEWGSGTNPSKAGASFGPASVTYGDASWREVNLPHDWAVELPFDPNADISHGYKALGEAYPQNSIGWYRRSFELPKSDAGKRIWLEFDGVFRDCTVFVNGWMVGRHESGYSSFRYDVTDVVECGGRNVVTVRVDATQVEGWFYEGAGIYRHVWLVKTAPLAIAPDGIFVSTAFSGDDPKSAQINLQARLLNFQSAPADALVDWQVFSQDGKLVASARQSANAASGYSELNQSPSVDAPQLWSPESPTLYKLVTTLSSGGAVIDRVETEFGIRTAAFDADKGFLLNGRPYQIKGTCNHQDHAGVGAAMPDRLQYFRISRLKEMGGNAYRTSHNPPTAELLEACDRLGMLVMDENRLLGSDATRLDLLERLVRRDRNHPSVVLWSICNEEYNVMETPSSARVASSMQRLIRSLDRTRPITSAVSNGNVFEGINGVIEVRGWNYHVGEGMDAYRKAHPTQPQLGTEQGSSVGTRGIYASDAQHGYVDAYDEDHADWARSAKSWWSFFDARPWLSGGFAWTGFDYRGEPKPYRWPCISSHFGILDTCGFPKDNFWNFKSWWTSDPVLHLMPHWNWPGREGQEIDVRALSNCDQVELFLNGRSLGRKDMAKNSELKWKVQYEPGVLSAKGFKAGRLAAEDKVETTGAPAALRLSPDRAEIKADREDIFIITISALDTQGSPVPTAGDKVSFRLEGPGCILGVGNGDPSCHEPDVFIGTASPRIRPIEDWRWQKVRTIYEGDLPELAVDYDDSKWTKLDVNAEKGPLGENESGVFRCRFTIAAEELAASSVDLWFGRISGDVRVYLNGQKIGNGGSPKAATVFGIKVQLREGENTISIAMANFGEAAGVNKGAALCFPGKSAPVTWTRSLFNGLAQIIVQNTGEPGALKLIAESPGLKPAELLLQVKPSPSRPSVP